MQLIGYTCSYIPVEILSATGWRPYRLLHGEIDLSKEGEKLVRVDACPLVKSNIQYMIQNRDRFAALVGSTGCDMSRRMFDVISEVTDIPVLVLDNPRTDNPGIYGDEIDWLVQQLACIAGKKIDDTVLEKEIIRWERMRQELRIIDAKRASRPSLVSTTDFHKAVTGYHQGAFDREISFCQSPSEQPRIYLLGSAITYEAEHILRLIEKDMRIVGDHNCGLSRALDIKIEGSGIEGIKRAYYDQPPCIFKRPHDRFYRIIREEIERLDCAGIVAWTLDYCDVFEFEIQKIERAFGRPVMRIRSDFSFANHSQLRTRIDAFAEMLC